MYNPYDHYFTKAKKTKFRARSAFKLEEIDNKFHIFDDSVKAVIDVWCSPWSWLQYVYHKYSDKKKHPTIIWFDLKPTSAIGDNVFTYQQDIEQHEEVQALLLKHHIDRADVIISDMAPDTTGDKWTDSLRSVGLIESTLWMYDRILQSNGKFVIKVFMGPGFDELRDTFKSMFGAKNIKVFKPKACRKNSKETYIIGLGRDK